MEKLLIINELDQLKSISDPFRLQLVGMMADEPKTGQMLADELGLPRAKIHYHLNQLLSHNIITVSHTVEKSSIIQKFYRPAAEAIVPSINIFNFNNKNGAVPYAAYTISPDEHELEILNSRLTALENSKKDNENKKETATADEYAVYMLKTMREA
ncbi:Helix-turn-helix domain protein [Jeotgalicoccus saudimassiliensis]|uniref:Helix-turn-helix domain protein n=1 Tax=Jeotgalicoccus saudimassiliensis TaxID=1461582 RepID=A0A078M240_9STAP|nr:helix-turn-helix domain-containing protein [Jeotgalicoccus saudimassiliensis]CDZ98891.1 Helix-turn-helix domain protein [Jeotgalicoccus saudimassiliensis]